jgi:thioredoxin reductase
MNVAPEDTPVVVLANGRVLKNPSTAALADELHLRVPVPGSENGPHSILETSVPGLFAAGDVRSGATRRVAAAMGEGAIAVALAGQYLTSTGRTVTS